MAGEKGNQKKNGGPQTVWLEKSLKADLVSSLSLFLSKNALSLSILCKESIDFLRATHNNSNGDHKKSIRKRISFYLQKERDKIWFSLMRIFSVERRSFASKFSIGKVKSLFFRSGFFSFLFLLLLAPFDGEQKSE